MSATIHRIVAVTTMIVATIGSSQALAQATAQGTVTADRSVIWRADAALPAATVSTGAVLTIVAQSQRWYEVVIPDRPAERGVIARTQVQLLPGSPQPPARALRGDPAPAGAPAGSTSRAVVPARPRFDRGFVAVSGAYRVTASDFADVLAVRTNAELGRYETQYGVPGAAGVAVAAGGMFSRNVGLGAALSRVAQDAPGAMTGDVPHPFLFNTPRPIEGAIAGMRREELAIHGQLRALLPLGSRIEIAFFGGPSVFRVKQGIVRDVSYSDSYPYDDAAFTSATVAVGEATALGFNAGGDVALFPGRHAGFGFSLTYSRATADVPAEGDRTVGVRAGGVSAAAGLRLRF